MSTIGFRVTTKEIFYAIIDGSIDNPEVITTAKMRFPASLNLPQALSWYRENIKSLLNEFKVEACGIKASEPISRSLGAAAKEGATKRANIEGVLMEVGASNGLPVICGSFNTIGSLIGSKKPKDYMTSQKFRGVSDWDDHNEKTKEAILAGVTALKVVKEK